MSSENCEAIWEVWENVSSFYEDRSYTSLFIISSMPSTMTFNRFSPNIVDLMNKYSIGKKKIGRCEKIYISEYQEVRPTILNGLFTF